LRRAVCPDRELHAHIRRAARANGAASSFKHDATCRPG
jgi:hypothetical protein